MSENEALRALHQKMETLRQYLQEYDRRADAAPTGSEDRRRAEQAASTAKQELDTATEEYHRLSHQP